MSNLITGMGIIVVLIIAYICNGCLSYLMRTETEIWQVDHIKWNCEATLNELQLISYRDKFQPLPSDAFNVKVTGERLYNQEEKYDGGVKHTSKKVKNFKTGSVKKENKVELTKTKVDVYKPTYSYDVYEWRRLDKSLYTSKFDLPLPIPDKSIEICKDQFNRLIFDKEQHNIHFEAIISDMIFYFKNGKSITVPTVGNSHLQTKTELNIRITAFSTSIIY
jgi:hypothetical protein